MLLASLLTFQTSRTTPSFCNGQMILVLVLGWQRENRLKVVERVHWRTWVPHHECFEFPCVCLSSSFEYTRELPRERSFHRSTRRHPYSFVPLRFLLRCDTCVAADVPRKEHPSSLHGMASTCIHEPIREKKLPFRHRPHPQLTAS